VWEEVASSRAFDKHGLEAATKTKEAERDLFISCFWGRHPLGFDMEFWIKLEVSIFGFIVIICEKGFDVNVLLEASKGFCHIGCTEGRARAKGEA
jgi:hypothetical protein